MRRIRVVAGSCLCALFVIIEAAEMFTVVREIVPERLMGAVSQKYSLPCLIVGILLLWLGKAEGNEDAEKLSSLPRNGAGNTNSNSANPTQNVEQHFHFATPTPPEPMKPSGPSRPSHNVQLVVPPKFPATDDTTLPVAACFQNIPIPHTSVADFSEVRSKIAYFDENDEWILDILPGKWAEDDEPVIRMEPGALHRVVLAVYLRGRWRACRTTSQPTSWGTTAYDVEEFPLPFGRLRAVVTLIGEKNISLDPVSVFLRLNEDGTGQCEYQPIEPRPLSDEEGKAAQLEKGVLLAKIPFDYLPSESPTANGWVLVKEDRAGVAPIFSSLSVGGPVSTGLSIKSRGWYGVEYHVSHAQSSRCNLLSFWANFATDGRIYVNLQLPSIFVDRKPETRWIQFGVHLGPARREGTEGIVSIIGSGPVEGWDFFNLSLDDAVKSTFGDEGLTYGEHGKLLRIRIRGTLSLSEIKLLRR